MTRAGSAWSVPYCGVYAHMSPQAVPEMPDAADYANPPQARRNGLPVRCLPAHRSSCASRSRRSAKTTWSCIATSSSWSARKSALPSPTCHKDTEILFREALSCYSNNNFNAFASMCRRSASRARSRRWAKAASCAHSRRFMIAQDHCRHRRRRLRADQVGSFRHRRGRGAASAEPRAGRRAARSHEGHVLSVFRAPRETHARHQGTPLFRRGRQPRLDGLTPTLRRERRTKFPRCFRADAHGPSV